MTPEFSPEDQALLREMQLRETPDPQPEPQEPAPEIWFKLRAEVEDGIAKLPVDQLTRLLAANELLTRQVVLEHHEAQQWKALFCSVSGVSVGLLLVLLFLLRSMK